MDVPHRCVHTLVVIGLAALLSVVASTAVALPIYGITSGSRCDTCHIEPIGWANPDVSGRRCTVDCIGCHISTAGGGLRLADGKYYGKEVLPMFGTRPSEFADPLKYLPKGFPKKGIYKLGQGFSGWWPGKIKHTDIEERYGNIVPHPKWRLGGDFRAAVFNASYADPAAEGQTSVFPMQADLYALNESVTDLYLYVSAGLQGYKNTDVYGAQGVEAKDYFTIRELFLQYRVPWYGLWMRAGRFIPRFGWRSADHTAFTRQDLGFDQYFQAWGADIGINPNYFYADASFYFQGLASWPGDRMARGVGTTANIGWRDLGYQVGASFHYADLEGAPIEDESFDAGPRLLTGGLNWAINYDPIAYYGEIDLRRTTIPGSDLDPTTGWVASHEVNWNATRGVYAKFKYDYADASQFVDDFKHRVTLGVNVHPYTYVDIELDYRLNYTNQSPFSSFVPSDVGEVLLMTHVWF